MEGATIYIFTGAGIILIALVFYDIYSTILRARKHPGPISEFLNRNLWWTATRLTKNFDRALRHRILSSVGPLLMPFLITLLVSMLISGFALIYIPRMEIDFLIRDEVQSNPVFRSFYFSGVTLLTIGYGDILPSDNLIRVVALIEGACGIAVISLSITYLITIYGAMERKRALALNFYHQGRQGADIPGFITRHFARGRFYSLTETLRDGSRDLQELLESHIEHPVINYFHETEVYKCLPRTLFFVLETAAILNALVDEKKYVEAGDHPDVSVAGDNARYVLAELVTALRLEKEATEPFESEKETIGRQKKTFNRAVKRLRESKIETGSDTEQAFLDYSRDRREWERQLYHLADFLGYDWDEVTGDSSLEEANDDQIIERHEILLPDNEEKKKAQTPK